MYKKSWLITLRRASILALLTTGILWLIFLPVGETYSLELPDLTPPPPFRKTMAISYSTIEEELNMEKQYVGTAERQYVGARYVPKFAEPYEWSPDTPYEPLTVVGVKGNSYTSKKFVPAGTPVSDTEYWALTGNLNGSINELQQQINAAEAGIDAVEEDVAQNTASITQTTSKVAVLEATIDSLRTDVARNTDSINQTDIEVDALTGRTENLETAVDRLRSDVDSVEDRTLLLITDSYGDYAGSSIHFQDIVVTNLVGTPGISHVYTAPKGSGGFASTVPFKGIFDDFVSNNPGLENIMTDVYFFGGANDNLIDETTLLNAIYTTVNHVKTTYPKARVHIVPTSRVASSTNANNNNMLTFKRYQQGAANTGAQFHGSLESVMHTLDFFLADLVHPNNAGQQMLGAGATEICLGREFNFVTQNTMSYRCAELPHSVCSMYSIISSDIHTFIMVFTNHGDTVVANKEYTFTTTDPCVTWGAFSCYMNMNVLDSAGSVGLQAIYWKDGIKIKFTKSTTLVEQAYAGTSSTMPTLFC